MQSGTVIFAGTNLGLYGTPEFTMRRSPSPAAPAVATHWLIDFQVSVHLQAQMPATVWARARALQALLASHSQAVLQIQDENGTVVSWMATPGENSLPQVIARGSGRVEMNFSALQPVSEAGYPLGIRVDPLNGDPEITLARPLSWSDTHNISRVDGRMAIRSEISTKINFSARTAYADPLSNVATRAEFLISEAARLNALSGKEARVRFASFDEVMQFESFTATPNESWDYIELAAQCRRTTLPGDDEAEVSFSADFNTDPSTGETRITVSGSIEAPDFTIAHAKADAILNAYRTSARRVTKLRKKDTYADGEDAGLAPVWLGIDFDFELVENTTATRYTLDITTREAADGNFTIYSGTASAADTNTLFATIETAAGGKHPVETRSDMTVKWETDDQGTLKLATATFSREYQTPSIKIRGSVKREVQQGSFGDWTVSVTGNLSAPALADASAAARKFIDAGVILRTDVETEGKPFVVATTSPFNTTAQFATLDFAYSWGTNHTATSIQYTDNAVTDYKSMTQKRTVSGTVWAANKTTASNAVTGIMTGLSLSDPVEISLNANYEKNAAVERWLSYSFSQTFETKLTGTIGHDLIEASWTLQRIGMVDHEPMTEIPGAGLKPIRQTSFGHNIGRLIASGSVKARQQSTARAWGQAKRAKAMSSGAGGGTNGAEDPPDERMTQTMVPFNGSDAAFHEFGFTYSFRYSDGLTGIWPSSLTV